VRIYCWDYNEGRSCGGYRLGKRMALLSSSYPTSVQYTGPAPIRPVLGCKMLHHFFVPFHPCADHVINDCHTLLDA
jgi:hypothetical protein